MFRSQEVIEYMLRATWSPEQIACTPCELKMPSWRTIYRWIYEKYLVNGNLKVLHQYAPAHMNRQRAASVGALGMEYYKAGKCETAAEHQPDYLRVSQAERERAERTGGK